MNNQTDSRMTAVEGAAEVPNSRFLRLTASITLLSATGTLLSILPSLISSLVKGMARPSDFGWLWLFVNGLEESNLGHFFFGSQLRVPSDLTVAGDLLRFLVTTSLSNSLLAAGVTLSLFFSLKAVQKGFRVPSPGDLALFAGAFTISAAPQCLQAMVPLFYRSLFPNTAWALTTAVLLFTTLGAAALMWVLVFYLFRLAGRLGHQWQLSALGLLVALSPFFVPASMYLFEGPQLSSEERDFSPGPNVVLVSIDSLRADHLHCYGYPRPTSPNIDLLAKEGARFETVVAPTSWTLPSHVTLLTALPPENHGVVHDGIQLAPEALTLAEVLRGAGYATAALVSAPYLNASYGFYQGFEYYDDFTVPVAHGGQGIAGSASERWITSELLAQEAERILTGWRGHGSDRPFFLFLHMWDVHYDYIPPKRFDVFFPDDSYRGDITGDFEEITTDLSPIDLERVVSLYDGEIRLVDEFIGRIVSLLRNMNMLDDTVFVVTADHGEEFLDHGSAGHRKNLYDESLLVPLIIRYPKEVPASQVVTRQARLQDVAPTILSLVKIQQPGAFGAFEGAPDEIPIDLTGFFRETQDLKLTTSSFGDLHGTLASVRTDEFKLISYLDGSGKDELYRLSSDRREKTNLIGTEAQIGDMLKKKLLSWRARQAAVLGKQFTLSEELQRQLRALGYLR